MNGSPSDPERLEALVERHRTALHTYVSFRLDPALRRQEGVSDIVQSTLREVLANPGRFEFRGHDAFRAFLWKAAEHKIANKRRKGANGAAQPLDEPDGLPRDDAGSTPSALVERSEDLSRLQAAIDELPELERQVLTMRRFLELTPEEIGLAVDLSPSTVRYHLGKAMAFLSLRLGS